MGLLNLTGQPVHLRVVERATGTETWLQLPPEPGGGVRVHRGPLICTESASVPGVLLDDASLAVAVHRPSAADELINAPRGTRPVLVSEHVARLLALQRPPFRVFYYDPETTTVAQQQQNGTMQTLIVFRIIEQ
jgi:hypothetical protein